ncbi:MAG: PP2C family protein-serine/threonine phosphatase [Terriglobales bacterium]|jgi:sigma-B regulation protein RsbU (phosphoserine phosphatase)
MSEAVSWVGSESASESFGCDRVCDEHAREAELIQSSLLPAKGFSHECVEIAFRFTPFSYVGGDFADFFCLPDGAIGIYLGDVVGKGLPAAMYGALVMGTLRGIHKTGTDTTRVLAQLNERLVQRPIGGRFCSTLYALLNPSTRQLIFSNAGMPLPLLVSEEGCRQIGEGGIPSGMFAGATYERHAVQLRPGDCALFASDGLYELRNRKGAEFGVSEMEEVWAQCRGKSATESVNFLFDRQVEFSDGTTPHDDITAVVLKLLP